jgi:hypothetical protein
MVLFLLGPNGPRDQRNPDLGGRPLAGGYPTKGRSAAESPQAIAAALNREAARCAA